MPIEVKLLVDNQKKLSNDIIEKDVKIREAFGKAIECAFAAGFTWQDNLLIDNTRNSAEMKLENDTYLMDMSPEEIEKAGRKMQRAIKRRLREGRI